MSEYVPQQPNLELERMQGLAELIEQYFPDDKEFVLDMDFSDALGFVYGQLIEAGQDPDVVLREYGLTEENDEI